ncbi:hypothetical protein FA15DRAFT_587120 [Coprinopsis marcescibilis]|uniref:Transcription initiation factor TFIID subunit 8 n=1 Tax=Coprinopsis marcescibilis TaxID=230819 RepID=A0A5C3L378_COPMA|nr:hypothetical protein FA15DRAFT_587120 [Coprinopsis marcescibilis]
MYQPQPDSQAGTIASFTVAGYAQQFPSNYAPTPPIAGTMPFLGFGPATTALGGFDQASAKPQAIPSTPEPDVTPRIAAKAIQKLVSVELKQAGFEKGDPTAVRRLEYEVQAFVQQLYQRAHEYANLANRAGAIASDLLKACDEFDVPTNELYEVAKKAKRKRRCTYTSANLQLDAALDTPPSRSGSPELLPSDDEETSARIYPATLRTLPSHFPSLPPKHTYMKTPASPPKKAALPSLEKKLKTAGLVQKSLQNLLTATEDITNNEDAELLGHIVNWETGLHPRKRWKVSK